MRDSLSSSYSQVVLIYLYPFRRNSLLKSPLQLQIAKKHQNPYFRSSKSFKVIDVYTNEKLVTIACYDKQHDDDDDDEGRINFSVALSPKTTKTRNNKLKQ